MEATIGHPVSASDVTFSKIYDGQMHVGIEYSQLFREKYRVGIGGEYSQFRADFLEIDPAMNVKSTHVVVAYKKRLTEMIALEGLVRTGYAWNSFTSEEAPEVSQFDDSGVFVSPAIGLIFPADTGFGVKIGLSYKVIFEHFGTEEAEEDSTIRFLVIGIGIVWGF